VQGALIFTILWAQWTNPLTGNQFNNPISSSLDSFLYGKMQQRMLEHSFAAQQGSAAQRGSAPQPAQRPPMSVAHKSLAASDFRPMGPGHPTVEGYLSSPNFNADTRRTMRAMFDTTFAVLGKARRNNVATALAGALGVAMGIVSQRPLSGAAAGELILNVNDLLAESPDFARLRPNEKQAIYETLVMTTALLAFMQQAGQSNPNLKAQSVVAAQAVLQRLTGSPTFR